MRRTTVRALLARAGALQRRLREAREASPLADALAVSAYLVGCLRVLGTSEQAPEPPPGGALARWEALRPRVTPEEAIEALKAVIPPEVLARKVRP